MPDSAARLSRGHVCHEAHGHGLAPGVILKHISRTDSPRDPIHLGLGARFTFSVTRPVTRKRAPLRSKQSDPINTAAPLGALSICISGHGPCHVRAGGRAGDASSLNRQPSVLAEV